MPTVDKMIADIIQREGGFVDNPDDAGGATKYGISLTYVKGLGVRQDEQGRAVDYTHLLDLDHNGYIDAHDIMLVTPELAAKLYRMDFYTIPKFDKLEGHLQPFCFDSAVNHGPGRAVMFLQEACIVIGTLPRFNSRGQPNDDGINGPGTIAAAAQAEHIVGWAGMISRLGDQRKEFMRAIARNNPSQEQFLEGWLRRVDQLCIDIFHQQL
jgi:lysozyme family protein